MSSYLDEDDDVDQKIFYTFDPFTFTKKTYLPKNNGGGLA